MLTQEFVSTMVVLKCSQCGVPFGLEQEYKNNMVRKRETFHCPNGHRQWFPGKTDKQKIKDLEIEVQRQRQQKDQMQARHRDERQHLEYQVRGQKAAKTRIKNRVAAGVCPCCNRTFQNLARHMQGQHPEYTKGNEDDS